jgi:hypothetical protein
MVFACTVNISLLYSCSCILLADIQGKMIPDCRSRLQIKNSQSKSDNPTKDKPGAANPQCKNKIKRNPNSPSRKET